LKRSEHGLMIICDRNCCIEMGNSPSGTRLLGNGKYSYNIKMGEAATISVLKDEKRPRWKLVYDVDGMTSSVLWVFKTTDKNLGNDVIFVEVADCDADEETEGDSKLVRPEPRQNFGVKMEKGKNETGLFSVFVLSDNDPLAAGEVRKQGVSRRGEVETQFWAYGCGTRKGLFVVVKKKKKSNEKLAYMVTVAHYYVNSESGCGVDMGFSVVVKIGVNNGVLDFSVDGPEEHPTSALLFMIEEVIQTASWNPSACPHCKNIQSQRRRWLSESEEDSDAPFPAPPRYGGSQNTANKGRFNGDGIGSMIQAKEVNFNKWWRFRYPGIYVI